MEDRIAERVSEMVERYREAEFRAVFEPEYGEEELVQDLTDYCIELYWSKPEEVKP